ncbi:MAG TPA: molybdopterin-dependent oxidoreductase [Candidatus Binataceae bacterium]|nr:molybdopterin-dependent oxidoreductase [Candidatus Binataceae bacterium]
MNDGLKWQRVIRAAMLMIVAAVLLATRCADAQTSPAVALQIDGAVPNRLELGAGELAALPRHSVSVTDEAGASATYDGVSVIELLRRAGAPLGKELKGAKLTLCVIARGFDGYRVAFALADLDPGIGDLDVIVADRRNGKSLDSREGPLRLVVPSDKRHARWVRGVISLSLENPRRS